MISTVTMWKRHGGKREFEVVIEGVYVPPEKEVLYPIDDAYPGCPASIDGLTVTKINNNKMTEKIIKDLSNEEIDELETILLESM